MKTEKKNMNNFSDFCNKGEIKLGKTGMMEKKNVKIAVIKLTMNGKPQTISFNISGKVRLALTGTKYDIVIQAECSGPTC